MAIIRPFQAYRPAEGQENVIAALPYDVYNRQEAVAEVQKNPGSFLAIDRAETQFGPDVDTYDLRVYEKARTMIQEWISDGRFIQDEKPCYYLYEQVMDGRSQTGICACASIDDYQNNIIKKHENTRADKEQDRINHVNICNMQTGPIFLAYRSKKQLSEIIASEKQKKPVYDFVSEDGITHRVWVISQEAVIEKIRKCFEEIPAIYIADGHHRCASAVKVGQMRRDTHPNYTGDEEFNYFLCVCFPDEELKILDYNRFVKDLNGMDQDSFLDRIKQDFDVRYESESGKSYAPSSKGNFGMYLDGKWYSLKAKDQIKSDDPVKGLDVSMLQDYLLGPVLGIGDPKTDNRIDFIGGIRGLGELERRCKEVPGSVAFAMYPTSISELFAVADAGRLMPPKSTWFEPKLRSGLFLHDLED